MEVLHERCAGLDVHKRTVVACVITPEGRESRTFTTMTEDLLKLADWLVAEGVTHVAMESTGVYWKPLYNLLEGTCEVLVVNAHHIKAVPGRKTDVKDAEWLADLLRHGLVQASFIPSRPQRELRELTRYRTALVRERAREVNRLQKVLEGANIKLASVATDVVGRSGRAILEALLAGEVDPATLADLAKGRLREKRHLLTKALAGRFGSHQRFLVAEQLAHLDFLEESIARVDQEVAQRLSPFEEALQRLQTIPGAGRRIAEVLTAEVGIDLTRFPSAHHLASWAGVCPGNYESAGKQKSGKTRKGSPWLKVALVEAAHAAGHTRTYLGAQYHRLAARRGKKRSALAVAHTILLTTYHLLNRGTTYQDLGQNYFDLRDNLAVQRRLVRRLEALGLNVSLQPVAV